MNINAAFPSKYLRAADLPPGVDIPVTISSVVMEDVSGDGSELKPVLYFQGKSKGVVLNKTNGQIIGGLYGPETDGWTGQALTIYHDPTVAMMGRVCGGIRCKAPTRAVSSGPPAEPVQQQHEPVSEDEIPF